MGEYLNMSWFSNKKKELQYNHPENMTPIEAVTHLCASIQLADGQADYHEREAWVHAVSELFPEFSEERADRFLNEAHKVFKGTDLKIVQTIIREGKQRIHAIHNEIENELDALNTN